MKLTPPTLDEVRQARVRIHGSATRTPLLKYQGDPGDLEIYLKLENLQPIGSFKLRGALNKLRALPRSELADGVYTASAGNMAQGIAWAARELGVPAAAVVPDSAPAAKREAIERLGATVVPVPYDEWWNTMRSGSRPGMRGVFVHPFADREVMAGNGTIALEIDEEVSDVDAVLVPWGGGGLACGIAAAARALNPSVRVYACEAEGSAPLAAARAAGKPVLIEQRRSFIDGIGGRTVFEDMWPLAQILVDGALVSSVQDITEAVRLLARRARVVAEGAGAASLAAARNHAASLPPGTRRVVCIVSGGNIDPGVLATILSGSIP